MRPYVLSIAGFDPSGGAGLLADCKTFEQHRVQGLCVCSALTVQTGSAFHKVDWLSIERILEQLQPLLEEYPVEVCKIGLVESAPILDSLIDCLRGTHPDITIVVDPILKASAGFDFQRGNAHDWVSVYQKVNLITPNTEEAIFLLGDDHLNIPCNVLLKGGHNTEQKGRDSLLLQSVMSSQKAIHFLPSEKQGAISEKHGSGCVLSAAIAANLALGNCLEDACRKAKQYIEQYLASSPALLGFHQ